MKKNYALLIFFAVLSTNAQVGIGTANPKQMLHLAKSVGSLRIEGLNKNNSPQNGGQINGPSTTYPLYVDSNGILTLDSKLNSDPSDNIDNSQLPAAYLTLLASDADGLEETTYYTYSINLTRSVLLEIKYNISFEVYANNMLTVINDGAARRISTYYTVNSGTRKYGQTSKCYFNNAINGAVGTLYNSSSTFIPLNPGSHTIKFKAQISTAVPAVNTYVKLAVGTDSVFMKFN